MRHVLAACLLFAFAVAPAERRPTAAAEGGRLQPQANAGKAPEEQVTILVATEDLAAGLILREPLESFRRKTVAASQAPSYALTRFEQLRGYRLKNALQGGQPVRPDDCRIPFDHDLLPNWRAFRVGVPFHPATAPRSAMDVYTLAKGTDKARCILQRIRVLAVDWVMPVADEGGTVTLNDVTLEVCREEAHVLSTALQQGQVQLLACAPQPKKFAGPGGANGAVLVARQDLPILTHFTDPTRFFEYKIIANGEIPRNALTRFDEVEGWCASHVIRAGRVVTEDDLGEWPARGGGSTPPPAYQTPAFRVSLDPSLSPGMRADIIWTGTIDTKKVTRRIIENVRILAVGKVMPGADEAGALEDRSVTLEVTPEQSELLSLAVKMGSVRLATPAPELKSAP